MSAELAKLLEAALREGRCVATGPVEQLGAAELDGLASSTAGELRHFGVVPSEPVAIMIGNQPADLGRLLGVWLAGAVAVPLGASAPAPVLTQLKAAVGARITLGPDGIEAEVQPPPAPRAILCGAALVIFTSGSTGRPKGVVVGHEQFAGKLGVLQSLLGMRGDDVVLVPLQLTFIFGLWVSLLALLAGARLVLMPRYSVSAVTDALASGATVASVVPTMLRTLSASALPPAPALRLLLTGGESLGASLAARIGRAYPQAEVFDLYGTTETGSCDFCLHTRDTLKQGTIGTPTAGVAFAIVGDDGTPAQPGEIGELRIRTPYGMLGYLDEPEMTSAAFADGLFRTGDLARVKPDGMVDLVGRRKEIISRGGIKIAPLELEAVFACHPDIEAALCGGVADQRLGEAVHLLVVRRRGTRLEPQQLKEWAAGRIERNKLPDAIHFVDQLPVGGTGKADRGAVASYVATAGRDAG